MANLTDLPTSDSANSCVAMKISTSLTQIDAFQQEIRVKILVEKFHFHAFRKFFSSK